MNEISYQHEQLWQPPPAMAPWNLRLENPQPSEFGQYVLVGCEQAGIEMHHEVKVIDESGQPLDNVWVIFGYPGGGPGIGLGYRRSYWQNAPAVLKGNAQKTFGGGCARHTFHSGGEDIWIWDIDAEGDLKLPSPIVKNCTWQRTPVGVFEHTGVRLTFQRRRAGAVPLEARLKELETGVRLILQRRRAGVEMLEARVETLEKAIGLDVTG